MADGTHNAGRREFLKKLGLFGAAVINPLPTNLFDAEASSAEATKFAKELYNLFVKGAGDHAVYENMVEPAAICFEEQILSLPEIGAQGNALLQEVIQKTAEAASGYKADLAQAAPYFRSISKERMLRLMDSPEVHTMLSKLPRRAFADAGTAIPNCAAHFGEDHIVNTVSAIKEGIAQNGGILHGDINALVDDLVASRQERLVNELQDAWLQQRLEDTAKVLDKKTDEALYDTVSAQWVQGVKPRHMHDGYIVHCKPAEIKNPNSYRERHENGNTREYQAFLKERFEGDADILPGKKDWFVVRCSKDSQLDLYFKALEVRYPHQAQEAHMAC